MIDNATLYAVQMALRTIGIHVTFRDDDRAGLVAERSAQQDVCATCGHYRFTHLRYPITGCNGQCACPGFREPPERQP